VWLLGSCGGLVSSSDTPGKSTIVPRPERVIYFFQDDDNFDKNKDLIVYMNKPDGNHILIPINEVAIWVNGALPDANGICTFAGPGVGKVWVEYNALRASYDIVVYDAKKDEVPQPPGLPGDGGIIIIITGP
jgi:hypothetical protein